MATKRQITLRFRDEYMKASKKDKGRILDEMCSVLAIGRSTARRRLAEAGRGRPSPPPEERLKRYSEQSRDPAGAGVADDGSAVREVFEGDAADVAADAARAWRARRL